MTSHVSAIQSGHPEGRHGRRPRDAHATREALLTAAAELFAEHGYDGVRVWAIADRARVNKAMISYHFGGKRELHRAILHATFSELVSRVEHLAEAPRPAPILLRQLISVMAHVGARHQVFRMMLREVLAGGKQLDPDVLDQLRRVLAAVQRIVERGVEERAFRRLDPLLTHLSLVGSLAFFFGTAQFRQRMLAPRRLGTKPPDAARYVKHLQELFTQGLAAARSGRGGTRDTGRVASAQPRPTEPEAERDGKRKDGGP